MKIRSATPKDEAAVVALWQACGLTVAYNDPVADFRFAMGKPGSDILVSEDITGLAGRLWPRRRSGCASAACPRSI